MKEKSIISHLIWIWVSALLLALMPITEMPHLILKLNLLFHGWLYKGDDWLDLFLHGGGLLYAIFYTTYVIIVKLRLKQNKAAV